MFAVFAAAGALLLSLPNGVKAFTIRTTSPRTVVRSPLQHLSWLPKQQQQQQRRRQSTAVAATPDNNKEKAPWNRHDLGRLPSYSDNWLLEMHNWDQHQKITTTNGLTTYNEKLEQEALETGILEWQGSFQRNGLADFTPPMTTAGMQCLMIGDDIEARNPNQRNHFQTKLPWEEEAEADLTQLRVVRTGESSSIGDGEEDENTDMVSTLQTQLVLMPSQSTTQSQSSSNGSSALRVSKDTAAVYDCIVDQGLLGSVLAEKKPDQQVHQLLQEAAMALREHGIYVLMTSTPLSAQQKSLLESLTNDCGLDWQFDLDGISDETQQVCVARRFNAGEMPKVGRLSRYQP